MRSLFKSLEQLTRFYRRHPPRALRFAKVTWAQCGEDVFLKHYFTGQKAGFYVDVGAFHPYRFSNTCLFYQMGWRGINVEPSPSGFREFTRCRPRDTNLNLAVSHKAGRARFSVCSAKSGLADDTHRFKHTKEANGHLIEVDTLPLAKLLDHHLPPDTRIDFLSVDCEGHDETVLRSNRWEHYRPRIVLVEDHERTSGTPIEQLMASVDYRFLTRLNATKVFEETSEPA